MTDEDSVRRFADIVGVGRVNDRGNSPSLAVFKRQWVWHTEKFEHVQYVLAVLWPWLGARRQGRAAEVLLGERETRGGVCADQPAIDTLLTPTQ